MPTPVTPYPVAAPTISGNAITLDLFLRTPARVTRVLTNLALQRFVADLIFGNGPQATGGAVMYDQLSDNDLFLLRDVQQIAPGGEYPILTDEAPIPKVAAVSKWGGRVFVTDEARDRNAFDVARRQLTKLMNTIVRKVDTVAIAALAASPTRTFVGSDWTSASADTIIANLINAAGLVNNPDLGYVVDTVLLNPIQADELLMNKDFRAALQAASPTSILRDGTLGRMLNMDFYKSNRVAAGTAWIVQKGQIGGISDEVPMATKTYRQEDSDKTWIQGARRVVPYVTDPLAAVAVSGI